MAELAVVGLRGREHVDERVVHRVLQQAGVAPGGARGELVAFVEPHARAVLGQERGERAADDAAAHDRDIG